MTVIATASNPRFTVSRVDIDRPARPTPSTPCATSARASRRRAVLHHRRRRPRRDPVLEGRRRALGAGPLHRGHPAGSRAVRQGPAGGPRHAAGGARHGDQLDRLPRPGRDGKPVWYLVPDGVVQFINKHRLYADLARAVPPPRGVRQRIRPSTRSFVTATRPFAPARQSRRPAAVDKLAEKVLAIDVSDQLPLTDVFVLASAPNGAPGPLHRRRRRGPAARVGCKPIRREGERDGRWVLLDFGDIVVHVQHAEERELLRARAPLERLPRGRPLGGRAAAAPGARRLVGRRLR